MSDRVGGGSRTALYHFYGADDQLLYVGITERLGERWEAHMRTKPWWPAVRRQTVHWYPTRAKAAAAEVAAIVDEKPLYNVVHSTRKRDGDDVSAALCVLETAEQALAQARMFLEAAAQRSADRSSETVDMDKLLNDLAIVIGPDRVRLSALPELLRRMDPLYLPYRKLKGAHLAALLRRHGIRITNTGNVRRLDPDDLRAKAS
jgi:predicted GIY-YIG superfamily endonuclease